MAPKVLHLCPLEKAETDISMAFITVTRIDRPFSTSADVLCRGKRSLAVNPKISSGREVLKKLIAQADVLIDPFRPGVMERLGLGPTVFLGSKDEGKKGLNERLIYARLAG